MVDTKTVELPLTKSEQRHLENINRRDAKRKRTTARIESVAERDAKLKTVNDKYGPKIRTLESERNAELASIWREWKKQRSTAE